jgi:hypothetical protein
MTRRGSLVFYLSAWILGCFFMSLLVWAKNIFAASFDLPLSRSAFGLLIFYFYGLVFGALAALIGAFLLRAVAPALKAKAPVAWAVVGALLAPLLIAALGMLGRRVQAFSPVAARLVDLLTWGPRTVLDVGWWLAVPAGAATGYLLCRIERAFAPERAAANV